MKRQMLSIFLTSLILISAGGLVSIVGATSHVTSGQVLKLTIKEADHPYTRGIKTSLPTNIIWALSVPLHIKGDDESS